LDPSISSIDIPANLVLCKVQALVLQNDWMVFLVPMPRGFFAFSKQITPDYNSFSIFLFNKKMFTDDLSSKPLIVSKEQPSFMRRSKLASFVHNHAQYIFNNGSRKVRCKYCGNAFDITKATSSFKRHLQKRHNILNDKEIIHPTIHSPLPTVTTPVPITSIVPCSPVDTTWVKKSSLSGHQIERISNSVSFNVIYLEDIKLLMDLAKPQRNFATTS
jgi:hypothetical protein